MIRTGVASDAEAVLDLWAAAEAVPGATDDLGGISLLLAHDPEALLVADADGQLVGSLIAAWDGWRAEFYRLAVHPTRRREGIAAALVTEGERRLVARGARRATALVVREHDYAVGLWRATGYDLDERIGRYVKTL